MFNPHELLDYEPVDAATLDRFVKALVDAHYTVSVRWSKGREIEAACGQLAAHYFHNRTAA
jgi:23S rRNA (adenine2503-C2)-methyltransferase